MNQLISLHFPFQTRQRRFPEAHSIISWSPSESRSSRSRANRACADDWGAWKASQAVQLCVHQSAVIFSLTNDQRYFELRFEKKWVKIEMFFCRELARKHLRSGSLETATQSKLIVNHTLGQCWCLWIFQFDGFREKFKRNEKLKIKNYLRKKDRSTSLSIITFASR